MNKDDGFYKEYIEFILSDCVLTNDRKAIYYKLLRKNKLDMRQLAYEIEEENNSLINKNETFNSWDNYIRIDKNISLKDDDNIYKISKGCRWKGSDLVFNVQGVKRDISVRETKIYKAGAYENKFLVRLLAHCFSGFCFNDVFDNTK